MDQHPIQGGVVSHAEKTMISSSKMGHLACVQT